MNPATLTPADQVTVTDEERAALSMLRAASVDAAGEHGSAYLGAVSSALLSLRSGYIADAVGILNEYALRVAFDAARTKEPR